MMWWEWEDSKGLIGHCVVVFGGEIGKEEMVFWRLLGIFLVFSGGNMELF